MRKRGRNKNDVMWSRDTKKKSGTKHKQASETGKEKMHIKNENKNKTRYICKCTSRLIFTYLCMLLFACKCLSGMDQSCCLTAVAPDQVVFLCSGNSVRHETCHYGFRRSLAVRLSLLERLRASRQGFVSVPADEAARELLGARWEYRGDGCGVAPFVAESEHAPLGEQPSFD